MKLRLFDKAAFSEPLIFKDPYFFKAVIHFHKCYFSEDAVYWKMLFSTANLVFTVSLFIYRLVINPGVFRFKFSGVYRKMHHSENHSMKYYEQKFCIKLAFQGSIKQGYLSKHVKQVLSDGVFFESSEIGSSSLGSEP